MTHCTALYKQIVGNLFFVLQKSTLQAGINHENKIEEKKKPALIKK